MEHHRSFTASEVKNNIDGDSPSKRTIRNTLNSIKDLGWLESSGGTGSKPLIFYPVEVDPPTEVPGYEPRASTQSGTFPYPGSKNALSEWIISHFPDHNAYVEVFGGSAAVLLAKPKSNVEIYNDINDDLTHFFTVVRNRPEELAEWLQMVPYSRSQYDEWGTDFYSGVRPDDPIERAGQFFSLRYMQHLGVFNAKNGFKTRARRSPARTFDNAKKRIKLFASRFDQVTIENRDYRKILSTYEDPKVDVLFYADPPYMDAEDQYSREFDHKEFVDCLKGVDNDWIVSYARVPEGLEDYTILERQSQHRMRRSSNSVTERLVCNFDPANREPFKYLQKE